eukprot:CAMPEP_0114593300 /NCGR_PEP_ID=MMETSP0125-20121206/14924_1 /TAXON_ID=485358 ORGANISM="Aristerostoma sp., Strain ATCC 50986" /NCGR_SAMPLE_ID=MMETSP0125 /ASSEMBLY_ACC=CAM_ASM_000245 /LENGTH=158 /DNA_ID=CAMNT_0001792401 /DNA_START=171 /DNA_END=647 /DNA_ORIENTATION=+
MRTDSVACVKNFDNYLDSARKNFKNVDYMFADPENYYKEQMKNRIRIIDFDPVLEKKEKMLQKQKEEKANRNKGAKLDEKVDGLSVTNGQLSSILVTKYVKKQQIKKKKASLELNLDFLSDAMKIQANTNHHTSRHITGSTTARARQSQNTDNSTAIP